MRLRILGVGYAYILLALSAYAQIENQDTVGHDVAANSAIFRAPGPLVHHGAPFVPSISNPDSARLLTEDARPIMCFVTPVSTSSSTISNACITKTTVTSKKERMHVLSSHLRLVRKSDDADLLQNNPWEFQRDKPNHTSYDATFSFLAREAGTDDSSEFFDPFSLPTYDSKTGLILAGRDPNSIKPNFTANILRLETPIKDKERFHWKPALLQSLAFLLEEHAFRMASDPYARHLVWHKPFWHDYLQSADHFVMSRWGDGDDFIVNYIGHPMQGAVSGLIQIQNDPHGRSAKFGKSSLYWQSRLKAMLWAGVYSAYFEIGPILSETALGNEGGYTYVPNCGLYPCSAPGRKFKPPTNNTGWVDFTVTPIVGMGWTILEDSIEREIVDRIAKDDPRLRYKLLRAGLSPSHSMANMLAGKYPWYRPTVGDETALNSSIARSPTQTSYERLAEARDEWEIGIGYTNLNLPRDWEGCSGCRVNSSGLILTFDHRLSRWFAFDAETDLLPGGGGPNEKGGAEEGLFGAKIGHPNRAWGIFTTVRIGFIHYDKALATNSTNRYVSMTRFASDVGEFVEYYPSLHSTVRFGVANTMVRYLTGRVDPSQPPVSVLSSDYIVTHSNLQLRSEYLVRF